MKDDIAEIMDKAKEAEVIVLIVFLSSLFGSNHFDHFSVGLAHAQFVVAHGQFHGVTQRCHLADIDLNTLGDAHVHDAALHGAFAMQLCHRCGLADLDDMWAVVAEAIQTILRREAYPHPYEALKALTRTNKKMTEETIHEFINGLNVSDEVKAELMAITPHNYTGM